MFSPLVDELIAALRVLPGVGPKTAQRMALYLLEKNRPGAVDLADALEAAVAGVGHCQRCRNLSEEPVCRLCADESRDDSLLCVVENPAEVLAIEQACDYRGRYFVLMGHLSPIDGIGPQELGMDLLEQRFSESVEEVILATSPNAVGEATAYYITEKARSAGLAVSRLAQGVPLGGELEDLDGGTLTLAFSGRKSV